jgi:nuclear migration protein JNM1
MMGINVQVTYKLSYSPAETTQLSSLSSRLSTLESLLGLPLTATSPPILPTLNHLSSKLTLITSPSHLETLQTRIKSLITEIISLEEKREAARQRALLDPEDAPAQEQSDLNSKINALYSTLATIDSVAPLVGGVLERLRCMARVHADAAGVTQGVKTVEEGLEKMKGEAKEWRGALERVEKGMKDVGVKVGGVVEKVDKVVKDLERRVKEMGL